MKKLNAISLATCTMFVVAALHIYLGWDDRYFLLWLKAANFINGGICKRLVNLPSTQLNNETFDLRFTTSVKECSTLPLSECIVPGRVITDWEIEKKVVRFNTRVNELNVRNTRRFIFKRPNDPLIYVNDCKHVEFSSENETAGYVKISDVKHISIGGKASHGTKWVYAKCMDGKVPELNLLIYPVNVKKQIKKQVKKQTNTVGPNVIVLQVDGLSHRQYKSLFAETQKVLKEMSNGVRSFSFENHWVNGYNSLPNMNRMYCDDKSCDSDHILKHFKQAGYTTSWVNEYTYGRMGHPFDDAGSQFVDHLFAGNYYNGHWASDLTDMVDGFAWDEYCWMKSLRYLDLFARGQNAGDTFGSHAAVVVPNVAHSSERIRAKQLDGALAKLLLAWHKDGIMDNTIFSIVSDHGIHGSPINIFLAGEFEHRNPAFEIFIPKSFLQRHPYIEANLDHNTGAMTTHFDFYKTFSSLASSDKWKAASNTLGILQKKYNILLHKIPIDRSCQQAGIPNIWCNCWVQRNYTCL